MTELPYQLLPDSLKRIAEYCGIECMWLVLETYGGGHLRVPMQLYPGCHLHDTLGKHARVFVEMFKDEVLNIPRAHDAKRAIRDAQIRYDSEQGFKLFELCRKYNMTERQVRNIKNKRDPVCIRDPPPKIKRPETVDFFETFCGDEYEHETTD